jgi:hypothetical protein
MHTSTPLRTRCWRLLAALVLATVAIGPGHAGKPGQRDRLLEDHVRMLLVDDARQAFATFHKGTPFPRGKSRMLVGAELKRWLLDKRGSLDCVPEPTRTAVRNDQGLGLLLEDAIPGDKGDRQDVVYLRPARFGAHRIFVNELDPCGDGNPAMCEYCSGCSGESSPGGTISTCVCTMGCGSCRPCPSC